LNFGYLTLANKAAGVEVAFEPGRKTEKMMNTQQIASNLQPSSSSCLAVLKVAARNPSSPCFYTQFAPKSVLQFTKYQSIQGITVYATIVSQLEVSL